MDRQKDKIQQLLERYEREQREFEGHWLWKQLGTTPREFFSMIEKSVQSSGLSEGEWKSKLQQARQVVATRVQEAKGNYQQTNLQAYRGLRV